MFTRKGTDFYYNGVNDSILGFYRQGKIEELMAFIDEEIETSEDQLNSLLNTKNAILNNDLEALSEALK